MVDIITTMNEVDKLKKKLYVLTKRIDEALSIISAEQEILTIILNSFNYKEKLNKRQIAYILLSNKISIEIIRSILEGNTANYNFKDVTYKDIDESKDYEKTFKKRIRSMT